ncbi:hypothetical protein BCI9360_02998 [Bacillus sp. CECT 9360]|nr:hypothetical protein BCI9360_02998 [Bacillus sp. CECT 9360]
MHLKPKRRKNLDLVTSIFIQVVLMSYRKINARRVIQLGKRINIFLSERSNQPLEKLENDFEIPKD